MKICLDIDDGSVLRTRWDLLFRLREHYPNLKVSLFWVPYDYATERNGVLMINWDSRLKIIRDNQDWVEVIPHGLSHAYPEFEKADEEATRASIKAIETILETQKIKYAKGFKAPFWKWNEEVCRVLDDLEYFGASDPNQMMPRTKRDYQYTDSIDTKWWENEKTFYGLHGHMCYPDPNNLEDCMVNLLKIPQDAEFLFVSEALCLL